MNAFLQRGDEVLAKYPNFKLVGRDQELITLSSTLTRSKANSVLLVGPGGVGITAICLGLQAAKADPNAPFDLVSKRFFFLDVDGLFSSGDQQSVSESFKRIMEILARTPDSVLVIEDARDFIEACRNGGYTHFINALTSAVKSGKTQAIIETRDDDLDVVLKCHSDMRECFTMMDIQEPVTAVLGEIVKDATRRLTEFHGIRVSQEAIDCAIMLTTKYRTRDAGLSRAQPERSVTLLDRALASYRLREHSGHSKTDALRKHHSAQREAETAVLQLEDDLAKALAEEESKRASGQAEVTQERKTFQAFAQAGGFHGPEVTNIKAKIKQYQEFAETNRAEVKKILGEINANLELKDKDVLKEFSNISGISADKLNEDERVKLSGLEASLKTRVFGQDEGIKKIADGIKVHKLGKRGSGKPEAFLILGPSGVGKTEVSKALAVELLGDEEALTRFDMSEYMEKHAVAKLIGAPPGYEGFEVGGILTNAARKNPVRVYLFDEIEKAHPDVFNVFLQILSDGRLTDNVGRTVMFGDAIIVMTTNIGQTHFLDENLTEEQKAEAIMGELNSTYRSEFLNRFKGRQNILQFRALTIDTIEKIIERTVRELNGAYQPQGVTTIFEAGAVRKFCEDHYDPKVGARGLPGYIQANLEPVIVDILLSDENTNVTLTVGYEGGKFKVHQMVNREAA